MRVFLPQLEDRRMKCAIAFFILLAVGAVGAWTAHGALMASLGASTALIARNPRPEDAR